MAFSHDERLRVDRLRMRKRRNKVQAGADTPYVMDAASQPALLTVTWIFKAGIGV